MRSIIARVFVGKGATIGFDGQRIDFTRGEFPQAPFSFARMRLLDAPVAFCTPAKFPPPFRFWWRILDDSTLGEAPPIGGFSRRDNDSAISLSFGDEQIGMK